MGCEVTVVFTRPPRPPPSRGSARRRGQDVGYTPTVELLKLLLPIYRINCKGSGASSEKIAQELGSSVELNNRQYLIPRLDQLTKWWTSENTRDNSPLLALGSRVLAVVQPQQQNIQGDGEPAKKKKKKTALKVNPPVGVGVVVSRNASWWYVVFGGGSKQMAFHAKQLQLDRTDALYNELTHSGRPTKTEK